MLKHKAALRNPLSLKLICMYPMATKLGSFRRMRVFALPLSRHSLLSAVVLTKADGDGGFPLVKEPSPAGVSPLSKPSQTRRGTVLPVPQNCNHSYRFPIIRQEKKIAAPCRRFLPLCCHPELVEGSLSFFVPVSRLSAPSISALADAIPRWHTPAQGDICLSGDNRVAACERSP